MYLAERDTLRSILAQLTQVQHDLTDRDPLYRSATRAVSYLHVAKQSINDAIDELTPPLDEAPQQR